VAARKQRGFFLFYIFKEKPSQALAMEKLNSLQSVKKQAEEWAET